MKNSVKFAFGVIFALAIMPMSIAEEISFSRPEDWLQSKALTVVGDNLRVKGTVQLHSKTIFKAEPECTYRLMGTLKMVPGSVSAPIHYGIQPLDAKKQPLYDVNKASATTVAAAAKAGDKELFVALGEKWQIGNNRQIALFPGLADESVIDGRPTKITHEANGWRITLSKPLTADISQGAAIAQKLPVPALYFEVARSSEVGIQDPKATSKNVWHPGIKYFRVLVLANWKNLPKDSPVPEIEMSNLRLVIE